MDNNSSPRDLVRSFRPPAKALFSPLKRLHRLTRLCACVCLLYDFTGNPRNTCTYEVTCGHIRDRNGRYFIGGLFVEPIKRGFRQPDDATPANKRRPSADVCRSQVSRKIRKWPVHNDNTRVVHRRRAIGISFRRYSDVELSFRETTNKLSWGNRRRLRRALRPYVIRVFADFFTVTV